MSDREERDVDQLIQLAHDLVRKGAAKRMLGLLMPDKCNVGAIWSAHDERFMFTELKVTHTVLTSEGTRRKRGRRFVLENEPGDELIEVGCDHQVVTTDGTQIARVMDEFRRHARPETAVPLPTTGQVFSL